MCSLSLSPFFQSQCYLVGQIKLKNVVLYLWNTWALPPFCQTLRHWAEVSISWRHAVFRTFVSIDIRKKTRHAVRHSCGASKTYSTVVRAKQFGIWKPIWDSSFRILLTQNDRYNLVYRYMPHQFLYLFTFVFFRHKSVIWFVCGPIPFWDSVPRPDQLLQKTSGADQWNQIMHGFIGSLLGFRIMGLNLKVDRSL